MKTVEELAWIARVARVARCLDIALSPERGPNFPVSVAIDDLERVADLLDKVTR